MAFDGEYRSQPIWEFDLGKVLEAAQRDHHPALKAIEQIALHIKQVGRGNRMAARVGIDIEARHQKLFHSSSGKPSASMLAL